MLMPYPYNPDIDFLWLYRDETVNYLTPEGNPVSVVKKHPYAWNPNSPLYGYRQSLEGLQASVQSLSTNSFNQSTEPWVSFYTHGNPSTANPYFWNSYPPAGLIVDPNLSIHCRHCYGVSNTINYPGTDSSFRGRYATGEYLYSIPLFRFISSADVIHEYADIGALWTHIDGVELFGGGNYSDSEFSIYRRGVLTTITREKSDIAFSVLPTTFPFTPVKMADPRQIYTTALPKLWCVDNNGKICDGYKLWLQAPGSLPAVSESTSLVTNGQYSQRENVWLHDSGNRWFIELQPPTSVAAGDGVLGWLGFTTWAGTGPVQTPITYSVGGRAQSSDLGPTTLVAYSDTDIISPDERTKLDSIGFTTFPVIYDIPNTEVAPAQNKTAASALSTLTSIKNLLQQMSN